MAKKPTGPKPKKFVRGAIVRGHAIKVGKTFGALSVLSAGYPSIKLFMKLATEHEISPVVASALVAAVATGVLVGGKTIEKANKAELRLFLQVQGRPRMAARIAGNFERTNKEFAEKLRASGAMKQRLKKEQIEEAIKAASKNYYLHPLHT